MKARCVKIGGYTGVSAAALTLVGVALAVGCDSNQSTGNGGCAQGELRCACYANKTCNEGLACMSNVCVEGPSSASGGATGSGSGGSLWCQA